MKKKQSLRIFRTQLLSLPLILSCFFILPKAVAGIGIQKPAPEFSVKNTKGEVVNLKDFKGKTVVLEWTNDQCPYVVKHYGSGNMQALQSKYTDKGIVWLSLISSAKGKQGHVTPEQANELTTKRSAKPSHVLLDESGKTGKLYGARTTPHMYIIDENGVLQYAGGIDSIKSADPKDIPKATNYVAQALDEMLAGKAVSQPASTPYGCSIKY